MRCYRTVYAETFPPSLTAYSSGYQIKCDVVSGRKKLVLLTTCLLMYEIQ